MGSEFVVEQTVIDWAEENGFFVRKVQWFGRRGAPDRLFAKNGKHVFAEFKAPGKGPSLVQDAEIRRMREAGLEVVVWRSVEEALRVLARF